jgi:hypothetical protein
MSGVRFSKIMSFATAALVLIAATLAALPKQQDGRIGHPPHASLMR